MSRESARLSRWDSRREVCLESFDEEDDLDERFSEECLEDDDEEEEVLEDLEDFSAGTSRMFKTRPVVGSVVEACLGSWETWYPSMM